jgi:hypothetical protein
MPRFVAANKDADRTCVTVRNYLLGCIPAILLAMCLNIWQMGGRYAWNVFEYCGTEEQRRKMTFSICTYRQLVQVYKILFQPLMLPHSFYST